MSETEITKTALLHSDITENGISLMKLVPIQVKVFRRDETTLLRFVKNGDVVETLKLGPDAAQHLGEKLIESAFQARGTECGIVFGVDVQVFASK